jgi:hypothetical protein
VQIVRYAYLQCASTPLIEAARFLGRLLDAAIHVLRAIERKLPKERIDGDKQRQLLVS